MRTQLGSAPYTVPAGTRIGHIHLQVTDLDRALAFYCDLLGFEVMVHAGAAAFLSADSYHHHIGLNTWHSRGGRPAEHEGVAGLFHAAILYQERAGLAQVLRRLREAGYPLSGAADHGASEALYLNDPDGNGLELYWDRPRAEWPVDAAGKLTIYTHPLDVPGLLARAQ
ncbi:VOC family protein [Hymenobacter coccineus]|uniref:Glyoxalase n=1 Tax=Hymenobacter coccineus TaxID=1908235 RepID=A0A1G1TAN2_9BACT|nr:VOC family protein [Hymenobacter coccineus]OGX87939.1 glyoxalase [Hymenobacter coccineus]